MPRQPLARRVAVVGLLVVSCLAAPAAAGAQDVPFAFLIKDGWKSFYAGQAARIDQGLLSWYGYGALHAITNGQKGAVLGTAFMQAYTRAVPDPTFSAILPLGGLITLDFGIYKGHLALFDTPAGLRTTVAVTSPDGFADARISGNWVFGDGASIGGGTSDDMVVGVLVHFGPVTPLALGTIPVVIPPYFPLVSFPNDAPFMRMFSPYVAGSPGTCLGSAYGQAQGALRVYNRCDQYGLGLEFAGGLLVMHTGGGNYAVLACSLFGDPTSPSSITAALVTRCSVSGTGPLLERLTGQVVSFGISALQERVMNWQVFLAP